MKNIIITILAILVAVGAFLSIRFYNERQTALKEVETQISETQYVQTYNTEKISALKSENEALYDSIRYLKNVESAVQIKYVYKTKLDTVFVKEDSVQEDSVYHFAYDNDTLKYELDVRADRVYWYSTQFELHDNFMIISSVNENDEVTTIINHSPNVTIEDATLWHSKKKNSFWDRIYYGPSVSVGYGFINKKPDVFVGFSIGYNLKK